VKFDPLLVATTNPGKLREIRETLPSIRLLTLADWPSIEAPEETGTTFAENALLKARYYAAATGRPTVAEDSGLEIAALGGAPGIESARFGGADSSYPEKFRLLFSALRASGTKDRTARYVCAVALVDSDQVLFQASGIVPGEITEVPRGDDGFGYDPIFYYPPFGCTFAEAGERKARVSHRAQAFRSLRTFLEAENR
jgi:XTP/dITP diphosphohydrolase